ncbi:hypothetical protein FHR90_002040 [Endobacter medicaginis]|uniref:Uncharacterized protein n=1 Tax=Endobacter medicaginis TaxID=1181271 RepID=A0A839V0Y2_9PROT|nr:hypothetical protein [Endobacter medicaginis]MBB3174204.1 hypothetical protein [Endobacter medicaginis]MCX5474248.1 hypothetical protein [Endobacter medicaginis]NVN30650.1 hypothetical protein [Endobacter medicaginis]
MDDELPRLVTSGYDAAAEASLRRIDAARRHVRKATFIEVDMCEADSSRMTTPCD